MGLSASAQYLDYCLVGLLPLAKGGVPKTITGRTNFVHNSTAALQQTLVLAGATRGADARCVGDTSGNSDQPKDFRTAELESQQLKKCTKRSRTTSMQALGRTLNLN